MADAGLEGVKAGGQGGQFGLDQALEGGEDADSKLHAEVGYWGWLFLFEKVLR